MDEYRITYPDGTTELANDRQDAQKKALARLKQKHPNAFVGANGNVFESHSQFAASAQIEQRTRLSVNGKTYWDVTLLSSENGRVRGPEYRETYRLSDGRTLSLTRHHDRGDLATDVEVR